MKRDCGKGDLRPVSWFVGQVTSFGKEEVSEKFTSVLEAVRYFIACCDKVQDKRMIMLYAEDKEGYTNCLLKVKN